MSCTPRLPPKSAFQQLASDASAITTLLPKRGDRPRVSPPSSPYLHRALIQKYILFRAIQGERRYLNIKSLAPLTLHLVTSAHHPRRRVEGRTARVCIVLARLEEWLLPNDTRPLDLGQFATGICNHPVP